jgi:hypothetical protein
VKQHITIENIMELDEYKKDKIRLIHDADESRSSQELECSGGKRIQREKFCI